MTTGPTIVFAAEKEAAAQRLGESLSAAGYPAELRRIGAAGGVPDGAPPPATILIWSKATMASAAAVAIADAARQRGGLVEVSIDGLAPVASQDRLALLSGWRGEPFHPGWQKILGEVARLCGPAAAARPARRAAPAPAASAVPPNQRSAPPLALAFLCLLLLMAGVAGAVWMTGDGAPRETVTSAVPDVPRPAAPAGPPPEFDPAAFIEEPAVIPPPLPPERNSEPAVSPRPTPSTTPKTQTAARPASDAVRTMRRFCEGSGRSTPQCRRFRGERVGPAADREPERAGRTRYRNARNMRRFCEGAGRATSQCRIFLRETRRR